MYLAQLDAKKNEKKKKKKIQIELLRNVKTFTQVADGKLQIGQKEFGKFKHSLNWTRPQR